MKLKQLDVYFVQETWLEGDIFDEIINGYHVFCHNRKLGNHNFHGIAIILPRGLESCGSSTTDHNQRKRQIRGEIYQHEFYVGRQ